MFKSCLNKHWRITLFSLKLCAIRQVHLKDSIETCLKKSDRLMLVLTTCIKVIRNFKALCIRNMTYTIHNSPVSKPIMQSSKIKSSISPTHCLLLCLQLLTRFLLCCLSSQCDIPVKIVEQVMKSSTILPYSKTVQVAQEMLCNRSVWV